MHYHVVPVPEEDPGQVQQEVGGHHWHEEWGGKRRIQVHSVIQKIPKFEQRKKCSPAEFLISFRILEVEKKI